MKRLILIVSLLAPVHTFANSCTGEDNIAVLYVMSNQSEYSITFKFYEAVHGDNPDDIHLEPYKDTEPLPLATAYGCSNGMMTGYEAKAALMMRVPESESYINLAYLHLKRPFYGDGGFSYDDQGINHPLCSCTVSAGSVWDRMRTVDCTTDIDPLLTVFSRRLEVHIGCK